jgi:hypothetical protein
MPSETPPDLAQDEPARVPADDQDIDPAGAVVGAV